MAPFVWPIQSCFFSDGISPPFQLRRSTQHAAVFIASRRFTIALIPELLFTLNTACRCSSCRRDCSSVELRLKKKWSQFLGEVFAGIKRGPSGAPLSYHAASLAVCAPSVRHLYAVCTPSVRRLLQGAPSGCGKKSTYFLALTCEFRLWSNVEWKKGA